MIVVTDREHVVGPFPDTATAEAFISEVNEHERRFVNDWYFDLEIVTMHDPVETLALYRSLNQWQPQTKPLTDTMTRNEAAERLLLFVEDQLQPQWKSASGHRSWQKAARSYFAKELAAERRATVERIRERVAKEAHSPNCEYGSDIAAILDEEAAP